MRPFNLEAAINGAKVVTRQGNEVEQIMFFDVKHGRKCVVGVLDGEIHDWHEDGHFFTDHEESVLDLFMASVSQVGWINIYKNNCDSKIYSTLEKATNKAYESCVATVKVEWEE